MAELVFTGKENGFKVFSSILDKNAVKMALMLCKEPTFAGSKIRLMPNVAASSQGFSGLTMTLSDTAIPMLLGDAGCGTLVVKLSKDTDLDSIDAELFKQAVVRLSRVIPQEVVTNMSEINGRIDLSELRCSLDEEDDMPPVYGLGRDIRFAELDVGEDGDYYLVIKAGSPVIRDVVLKHYMALGEEADDSVPFSVAASVTENGGDMSDLEGYFKSRKGEDSFDGFEKKVITDSTFDDFINDMRVVNEWGEVNRAVCADTIIGFLGLEEVSRFDCPSHYIGDDMVLRIDAISAKKGEPAVIPLNAIDGCLICEGTGNEDWNCSAPSCSGRILGNREAEELLAPSEEDSHINGFPNKQAYKPSTCTISCIQGKKGAEGTVKVIDTIRPIFSFNQF